MNYDSFFSTASKVMRPNAIRAMAAIINRPGIISFAGGVPSPETFPVEELADIAARMIREKPAVCLQYQPTRGNRDLLDAVVERMHVGGATDVTADQVVLTTGAQQGLELAVRNLLNPGDTALVVIPTYIGGLAALNNAQARVVGVREDADGVNLDTVEEVLDAQRRAGTPVKLMYTIPNFQNPSGVTLADHKRDGLLALASRYDFLILEDDPYGELYFDAPPPRSLKSRDTEGRVVYLGSFSKILSPGLRVGWMVAPAPLAARFELCLETSVLCPGVLDQAIVAEACRTGLVTDRLPALRSFYGERCRAMLESLDRWGNPSLRWTKPTGGLFIWIEAAAHVDAETLLPTMVEAGVAYVPGRPFCVTGEGRHTFRLAFSKETPAAIRQGMETLLTEIAVLSTQTKVHAD